MIGTALRQPRPPRRVPPRPLPRPATAQDAQRSISMYDCDRNCLDVEQAAVRMGRARSREGSSVHKGLPEESGAGVLGLLNPPALAPRASSIPLTGVEGSPTRGKLTRSSSASSSASPVKPPGAHRLQGWIDTNCTSLDILKTLTSLSHNSTRALIGRTACFSRFADVGGYESIRDLSIAHNAQQNDR